MAATKARSSIASSVTMTASAGDVTSTAIDLNTGYGAQVNIVITNGATGPTIAAQAQIQVANDAAAGTQLWTKFGGPFVAGVENNGVYYASAQLPIGVAAVRIVHGSNTGQNTTISADVSNVTAIS